MNLQTLLIENTTNRYFSQAMMIYQEAFPSNERQPMTKIVERIDNGKSQLFIGTINDEVVAMALLWNFTNSPFVLLDYLAVKDSFRGKQVGPKMFQFLIETATKTNQFLLLEVEHPQFGCNKVQRQKRIQFYLNNGAYLMSNVPYILPSLDGTAPTEMQLLIAPLCPSEVVEKERIKNSIRRLYLEIYEKSEDDVMLASLLEKVPEQINLTNILPL